MRSDWRDFLMSGLCITGLLALSLGVVWAIRPLTGAILAEYRVLFDAAALLIVYGFASALLVRILLAAKPMPQGEHGMDSSAFAYWKLITVLYHLGQGSLAWCTPLFFGPLLPALFGARIGREVAFGGTIDDPYLVSIGRGVVLGKSSLVSANVIVGGKLICAPVVIGDWATVGANSVVLPGSVIGERATLMSGSYLMPNTTVPAGETWRGNPARKWS